MNTSDAHLEKNGGMACLYPSSYERDLLQEIRKLRTALKKGWNLTQYDWVKGHDLV